MKKLVGLLVIMFIVTSSINAQGGGMRGGNQMKGNQSNYTPDQIATLQVKKMNLQLDLTKSQQDAIYKLQKNQAVTRQEMQKSMQERRLNGKVLTSDEKFQLKSARLDRMQQHKLAMQKILTPEQFTKWETMNKSKLNRGNANGCNNKQGVKGNKQGRQRLNN
jgi:hypothetical protein